ncbi:MAG: hypothetical protein Q8L55_01650, partial [Phycisphaerales bacterium]|nr:hypothetical protein [Phycisphaerales bacterium]
MNPPLPQVGAFIQPDSRTRFTVWAPLHERLSVHFPGRARSLEMTPGTDGYHNLVTDAPAGTLYQFEFTDGRRRPDPASLAQPEGVHGPSMVVDRAPPAPTVPFNNPPLASHVLYELHVGTFTP